MTLRLNDRQTEALRRRAEAENRSMQQVALAAIDAYVRQPVRRRQRSVPVADLMEIFADLPPLDSEAFRADADSSVDQDAYLDVYARAVQPSEREQPE